MSFAIIDDVFASIFSNASSSYLQYIGTYQALVVKFRIKICIIIRKLSVNMLIPPPLPPDRTFHWKRFSIVL